MEHSTAEAIINGTDLPIKTEYDLMVELREEVEGLTSKIKDVERNKEYYYEAWNSARAEIAQLHQLIDLLPNSPPRSSEPPEDQSWNKVDYTVANRLTAWIATLRK